LINFIEGWTTENYLWVASFWWLFGPILANGCYASIKKQFAIISKQEKHHIFKKYVVLLLLVLII